MLGQGIVTDTYTPEELEGLDAVFECIRRGNACEWHTGLSRFVLGYNQAYNKSYRLVVCFDAQNKTSKEPTTPNEPEVLLEADGEPSIVIERKSIMTRDYARSHGNFHALANHVDALLASRLSNGRYSLQVVDPTLDTKRKLDIRTMAEQISNVVLSSEYLMEHNGGVGGSQPVPWHFHEEFSRESSNSVSGKARIYTAVSTGLQTTVPNTETEIAGYKAALCKEARKAAKQLERYSHCRKLLLLEFYGDHLSGSDVVAIVDESPIPAVIDQVWLAHKEWVSELDYETCWLRVR